MTTFMNVPAVFASNCYRFNQLENFNERNLHQEKIANFFSRFSDICCKNANMAMDAKLNPEKKVFSLQSKKFGQD